MDFFGGLSNIFHSIGHFLGMGGNDAPTNNPPQNSGSNSISLSTGPAAGQSYNQNQNQNQQNPYLLQKTPQPQNQQQQDQPQAPAPSLNLYQGPQHNAPLTVADAAKAPLLKAPQQVAPQAPQNPNGFLSGVEDFGKGLIKAPVQLLNQAGSELANVGVTGKTEYDLLTHADQKTLNNDFAMEKAGNGSYDKKSGGLLNMGTITSADEAKNPDLAQTSKEFGGNFIQNAAMLATGGVDGLIEKGAAKLLPEATNLGGKIVANLLPKAATGAVVGGAAGGGQALEDGTDILKGMGIGAGTGAVAGPIIGNVVNGSAQLLRKAIPGIVDMLHGGGDTAEGSMNTATDSKVASGVQQPDEIEPGIKSVNPTQAQDALQVIQQKEAEQLASNPQPADTQSGEQTQPTGTDTQPANGEGQPTTVNPQQTEQGTPADETQTPNNQPAQPVQGPRPTGGPTAPNAPNIRAQAQKDLEAIGNQVDKETSSAVGSTKEHDVLSNQDLNDAAQRYTQSMSDDEIKQATAHGMTVNGAGDIAKAYAVIKRLGQMAANGDEEARGLIPGILDSIEQHVSGAGRSMNYTGAMLDSLPKEAQLEYIVKDINRTRTNAGLEPLSDAEEATARGNITKYLTEIEQRQDAAAGAKGSIEEIMARAEKGEATQDDLRAISDYQKTAEENTREANQLKTQVGKEYLQWAPQKGNFAKAAGDFARSSMLTKVTGRLSDIATTGINAAHSLIQNTVENGMGKLLNKATGTPGRFSDTLPSAKVMIQGTGQGVRDMTSNYEGNVETPDLYSAIRQQGMGGKSQLMNANSGNAVSQFVRKTGHAMAETATNLSKGVGTNKMYQMASQEAKQMGLEGDQAKIWTAGRVANPTAQMQKAGDQLVDEVNNMNNNPLTEVMSKWSKAFTNTKLGRWSDNSGLGKLGEFAGEQIRNIVAPFTRWAAGAAWNGATDKNAVANLVKIVGQVSMKDGKLSIKDPQELVHQLAGLTTNTAGSISAGYALASNGLISSTNAEGYNDEGMYLHVGSHYIPIGFLGFFAPGIIMGAAAHQAMTDPDPNKSVIQKIGEAASTTFDSMARSDLTNTMLGGNNEFVKQVQEFLQNKNGITGPDVAATAGADAAGSFIPGAAGDVNTAINQFNLGNLNPNHEPGLTKVTNGELGQIDKNGAPSTAKNIPASAGMALLNKIPVAGQLLVPRNPGVAANDLTSNITRGDNESPQQAEENAKIAQLPVKDQQTVRTALLKTNGAAQEEANRTIAAMPDGSLAKVKAEQAAGKMAFTNSQNSPIDTAIQNAQRSDQVSQFKNSNSKMQTIDGKTYANIAGQTKTFSTPQQAQQALDFQKFKDSGKDFDTINGVVYQKGSDGKYAAPMEQKDYDYKQATDSIKSAKDNHDLNGTLAGQSKLLDNITWQLNHANLTNGARDSLISTAAKTQAEYNKYALWGSFTKPKGAPSYDPTFTGGSPKTTQYIKNIQEAGAKYGVDINALLSVAAQEGLGGGVGDNGTSFGPFQMHEGGALPQGKDQAWAESPEGVDYAVKQIANVAKGKVGKDAINAIVTQFEKSANQPAEIANALSVYEGGTANLATGSGIGADITGGAAAKASASKAASLIKQNTIGSLPQMARESFIENGMVNKPITPNIPQIKLTDPQTLIKVHKITVGMPKA
jgi:hypothetical protein